MVLTHDDIQCLSVAAMYITVILLIGSMMASDDNRPK